MSTAMSRSSLPGSAAKSPGFWWTTTTASTRGDLLVQLDKEPYEDAVAVKRAAVETAKADLQAATARVRGLEAQARSQTWKLQNAMEDVDNQVALLHARVAALDKSKATLKLAN